MMCLTVALFTLALATRVSFLTCAPLLQPMAPELVDMEPWIEDTRSVLGAREVRPVPWGRDNTALGTASRAALQDQGATGERMGQFVSEDPIFSRLDDDNEDIVQRLLPVLHRPLYRRTYKKRTCFWKYCV